MEIGRLLDFLKTAEQLKCNTRHSYTSSGRLESVAEHSWRLALMAMLVGDEFPELDMDKVLRMCLIHDMGEAFTGDIPTFEKTNADTRKEDDILLNWVNTLPEDAREEWTALLTEMNAMETQEAKIYKALDKMEAVIQHNESDISTWLPLEYDLQLTYGEEVYRFELEPSRDPQLAAFYQVIVDKGNQQMTEGDSLDNLAATADPAYERQVDELMEKIMADVDENTRARQEGRTGTTTLSDYVDYRTYLDYDIKVTNRVTGQQAYLSRVSRDSSGGENQAPFYVAICASLLQIYQKSENSIRLVLLDEAFSKMTSDRIRPMMELFRRLQLQVLLISTVEKSTAIQPYCDITYSIVRHGDANAIAPFVRLSAE